MNRLIGLAGALCAAGMWTGAAAQQPLVQTSPSDHVIQAPVVVGSGRVVTAPANEQYATTAPVAAVSPTTPQPAPFKPAPLGTFMQTTADQRVIITENGYLITREINGKRDTSIAMLTDGLGENQQVFPPGTPAQFWPLEVGKKVTFNYGAGSPLAVTARVLRTETITVPAGTFYTYVIERRSHPVSDFREDVATYWYAPSVGDVVKFQEVRQSGASRKPYEMVQLVLPHPVANTIPVTTPGDTPERRAEFCTQHGTALAMPDGRSVPVPCVTYVEANLPTYTSWLNGQAAGVPATR